MRNIGRIALLLALLTVGAVCSTSVRSAWVDTSECPNEAETIKLITALKANGVTRVYVDAWQNGKLFFDSPTMRAAIGADGIGSMILPWFMKHAKQENGMEVVAWFEFGYISAMYTINIPFGLYALKKGWVLGECDSFYYMDPRTDATKFLAGILSDALDLGLDGVQMDDHFACPTKFSQCSADVLLKAADYISSYLRGKHGDKFIFSLAPAPMPEAIRDYRVDWHAMMLKGYFSEIIPLLYSGSAGWFHSRIVYHDETFLSQYKKKALIGIMVNGEGLSVVTPWDDVSKMIKETNERGYGVAIWYARGIAVNYQQQFHELWGK